MTLKKIISFGWRYGAPQAKFGQNAIMIDVRQGFRNPYNDQSLKLLTGLAEPVGEHIRQTKNFDAKYAHLKERASVPGTEVVYLGCTGGKHRSVFLADQLGKELGVAVEHRDIDKPIS